MCLVLFVLLLGTGICFAAGDAEAKEDVTIIKWFGNRGVPGDGAPIVGMLEELVSVEVGFPVEFELYGVADDNVGPKLQLMLAANDLPDWFPYLPAVDDDFMRQAAAKFSVEEMKEYLPNQVKGLLKVMNDTGLDEAETWARYQDATDGLMWGMPRMWTTGWVPNGQIWRTDILEELGYDIPATIAETEEVFTAFKAAYPDKYGMGGSGELDWQCFDQVFNAFGILAGGHGIRDGKVQEHFVWPEFKEALEVLTRWYGKGFIDPEFITHPNSVKFRLYSEGKYLTTEWAGKNMWELSPSTRKIGGLVANVPGAKSEPATHIRADKNVKAVQHVWNPFLLQANGFGIHLADDRDALHKVMQVVNAFGEQEIGRLAAWGIEGEHYSFDNAGIYKRDEAVQAMAAGDRADKYGFGSFWVGAGTNYVVKDDERIIDQYVTGSPDAIYGSNNVELWFDGSVITGSVTDEAGNDIEKMIKADSKLNWFVMTVKIVTGQEPIEYYDEWLDYYYENGGTEWEENATRLYLN